MLTTKATFTTRRSGWLRGLCLAPVLILAGVLSGCLSTPGDVSSITLIETRQEDGWTFDYYRNLAYPCAVSGYQTFVVGRRTGSDDSASRPLWVRMHGGGIGYFKPDGSVAGGVRNKSEEPYGRLRTDVTGNNLEARVAGLTDGFRTLGVSMCSHDIYSGANTVDPNNPNLTDGQTPKTNGLLATKAAIQFVMAQFPTDDFFLHGGSAGSAGSYSVAWGLQEQGIAPTGIVADAGVMNEGYELEQIDMGSPCARTAEGVAIFQQRILPEIADPANQPHLLIGDGRLQVPVMQVYSNGDTNTCAYLPMDCPMADGTTATLGSAVCAAHPVRMAIQAQGPTSRSASLELCVDDPNINSGTNKCDKHVATNSGYLNTAPGVPADYNGVILGWVTDRLSDD